MVSRKVAERRHAEKPHVAALRLIIRLTAANLGLKPEAIICRRSETHLSQRATTLEENK